MKLSVRPKGGTLTLPLWLRGILELGLAAVLSALIVALPLAGVWLSGGFQERPFDSLARLAGQAWLLGHGVPLQLHLPGETSSAETINGKLSLVPLGLTLIPFLLCWRAGRRLAQASSQDRLWQGLLGALLIYAALAVVVRYFSSTAEVEILWWTALLVPLVPAGLGLVIGAYREAGSWAKLIGVNAADRIAASSQHFRWAGSYLWAAARAGLVGFIAALALSALLLAVNLAIHWADIVFLFEKLDAGIVGGTVLTFAQLGLMPNFAVWTLAWASGAGFAVGSGSSIGALGTTAGPLPVFPVLGALPPGTLDYGFLAMLLPVAGGVLAGWWFLREGENHFDEWLAIKVRARWFTAVASTIVLGLLVGAVSGLLAMAAAWVARGSLGIGRLTDLGPNPLLTAAFVAAEVAVGVVIGYAAGPWLEREPRRRRAS